MFHAPFLLNRNVFMPFLSCVQHLTINTEPRVCFLLCLPPWALCMGSTFGDFTSTHPPETAGKDTDICFAPSVSPSPLTLTPNPLPNSLFWSCDASVPEQRRCFGNLAIRWTYAVSYFCLASSATVESVADRLPLTSYIHLNERLVNCNVTLPVWRLKASGKPTPTQQEPASSIRCKNWCYFGNNSAKFLYATHTSKVRLRWSVKVSGITQLMRYITWPYTFGIAGLPALRRLRCCG